MSRGYGLRRLAGGIAKREREAWERIERGATCHAVRCSLPATVLIQNAAGMLHPTCATHGEQGRKLGYTVIEPPNPDAPAEPGGRPSRGRSER